MNNNNDDNAFVAKNNRGMTVSEVIENLTKLRERYGDLPVNYEKTSGNCGGIWIIAAYDANGYYDGKIVEFFIH